MGNLMQQLYAYLQHVKINTPRLPREVRLLIFGVTDAERIHMPHIIEEFAQFNIFVEVFAKPAAPNDILGKRVCGVFNGRYPPTEAALRFMRNSMLNRSREFSAMLLSTVIDGDITKCLSLD